MALPRYSAGVTQPFSGDLLVVQVSLSVDVVVVVASGVFLSRRPWVVVVSLVHFMSPMAVMASPQSFAARAALSFQLAARR